ncbi:MAG: HIT domain-containing protein [Anaerolineaceae bacterium]|nr:HIT domain-containing protein [Anaerolineaceae bacterium]
MDNLWSPWRMKYISDAENPGSCVFCTAPKKNDDEDMLIVHRGKAAFVILNRFPYTTGHLMIVPYAHVSSIELLSADERAEMIELVNTALGVLRSTYKPNGFNVGINMGSAGGAGIAEHAHIHVVPRWAGDTNFMSTVGETRVIPEDLCQTFKRISEAWKE